MIIVALLTLFLSACQTIAYKNLLDEGRNAQLRGNYDLAHQRYQEAYDLVAKEFGVDDPRIALPSNNLAMALLRADRPLEAQALIENAIAVRVRTHGENHLETGYLYDRLGMIWAKRGNRDRAIENMERARKIIIDADGPKPSLWRNARRMGHVERDAKNFDSARRYYTISSKIHCRGCGSQRLIELDFAELEIHQENWSEAAKQYRIILNEQRTLFRRYGFSLNGDPFGNSPARFWINSSSREINPKFRCHYVKGTRFARTASGILKILKAQKRVTEAENFSQELKNLIAKVC